MANQFWSEEAILKELARQEAESDDDDLPDENISETSDSTSMEDVVDDVIDVCNDDIPEEVVVEEEGDENEHRSFVLGKDNETMWTTTPLLSKYGKTPAANVVIHLPGPKGEARGLTDESQLFSLFVTDEMLQEIVKYTNQEIERRQSFYQSSQWFIHPTNLTEIKALIGLLYMSAVLKNSGLNTEDMFSKIYGPPIFRSAMTKKRFDFLIINIRFDDKDTRTIRKATDKFAAFRDLWNKFEKNCSKYYSPSEYLTVDETLLSFRGKCPFKIYIPSKPDKYGLKIVSVCDARTFYFLGGIPYVGKEAEKNQRDLPLPTQYILRLTNTWKGTNRNITADNWFSSYQLTEELKKNGLTYVGTLRKNKPQIPPIMLARAPASSSTFLYQYDKMLTSYAPKKNKTVLLISSMHFSGVTNTETNIPEVIEFYNMTKGGVDVLDKLCHDKTTKRKTRRWPLRYFFGILDISAVNSYVLFKWNANRDSWSNDARSKYLKNLALSLVKPFMEERVMNQHLPRELRSTIRVVLGMPEEPNGRNKIEDAPRKRGRCSFCPREKDRKSTGDCTKCHASLCGTHKIVKKTSLCPNCDN